MNFFLLALLSVFFTVDYIKAEDILEENSLWDSQKNLVKNYVERSHLYKHISQSDFNFSGIVELQGCSGSLISFKGYSFEKALVLTNGHCEDFSRPGSIANVPAQGEVILYDSEGSKVTILNIKKIVYSSMVNTDLAIYELEESYSEIFSKYSIKGIPVAKKAPVVGEYVSVISGYHLSGSSCQIDAVIPEVKEYHWTWKNSVRYGEGCYSYSGVSGSPVISDNLREVVAINNTSYNGGEACSFGNPCEVDEYGNTSVLSGQGYAQNTFWIYNCIDRKEKNKLFLDFNQEKCLLDRPI